MGYRTLESCVDELAAIEQLVRVDEEVDPHLEIAEIHRRVCATEGPALLFTRVRGCRFPVVCNLFGTWGRAEFIFRDQFAQVQRLVELKGDAARVLARPWHAAGLAPTALAMLPRSTGHGAVLSRTARLSELPAVTCWPEDGGAFITLPLVYTEDPDRPGPMHSNLGMYRVQLNGGSYREEREVGLHYQIHRGIGVHHAAAIRRGERLRVNVFVGGAPSMMLAAVMPLPEGMSELSFAGALAGHRIPMIRRTLGPAIYAEADFCLVGSIDPQRQLPEGPFGDHFGYYAQQHDFPVLEVEQVYHRPGAIWPVTVVGRPPQEDTIFGRLIHALSAAVIPAVIPGVREVHAVDAAGVHPLLLAVGSERYTPYTASDRPQELLTQSRAILGQGQMSLAKYLLIAAQEDDPRLWASRVPEFLAHVLARFDPERDLHFETSTTIDTLDYSGSGLNQGSKLVIAARGPVRRQLAREVPAGLRLPNGFRQPRVCMPGVLAVQAPRWGAVRGEVDAAQGNPQSDGQASSFCREMADETALTSFPWVVLVDDSAFTAASLANFLWVTFTRSNPAADVYGVGGRFVEKHWGCTGSLVIDARTKSHHARPLVADPEVSRRVERLAVRGRSLHGILV